MLRFKIPVSRALFKYAYFGISTLDQIISGMVEISSLLHNYTRIFSSSILLSELIRLSGKICTKTVEGESQNA